MDKAGNGKLDVVIIGGGPTGLACGIEAARAGLRYAVVEKGAITDSIRRFPHGMTFFSTPELLELGGLPFTTVHTRPTRAEALQYYRRVVEYFGLNLHVYTRVLSIDGQEGDFRVLTERGEFATRYAVIATGYFDNTNMLNVPGEDLPHVFTYYDEPYRFAATRVAVIGGRNSAVETALELYRHGADVQLVHRRAGLGDSVKYWIKPDIENRLRKGEIQAHFNTVVREIMPGTLYTHNVESGTEGRLACDFVIKLIGYRPDEKLLRSVGIRLHPQTLVADYNPSTFESNVKGVYIAGSVACGCETWNIFIENGRSHALPIMRDIAGRMH